DRAVGDAGGVSIAPVFATAAARGRAGNWRAGGLVPARRIGPGIVRPQRPRGRRESHRAASVSVVGGRYRGNRADRARVLRGRTGAALLLSASLVSQLRRACPRNRRSRRAPRVSLDRGGIPTSEAAG